MTPVALNAALVACLGAGVADLTLLNLAVVPALHQRAAREQRVRVEPPLAHVPRTAGPERTPGPIKPAAQLASATTATDTQVTDGTSDRPPMVAPIAVLEFETSSHHLDGRARGVLRQSLAALRAAPHILIVGHTDESGPEAYNDRLSKERAEATLRQLLVRNIPAGRITLVARGERELLASGNSRRVEIYRGGEP